MEDTTANVWSTFIQRPETLYRTRAIRFRDERKDRFLDALGFKDGMSILEVGCGPGALCHALGRWLPASPITGVDGDSAFIEYAIQKSREHDSNCSFLVGDVTKLAFSGNTFDATTSHTVVEHVETTRFLQEQFRILRTGGICTLLSVCTGINVNPEFWENGSEEERALWERVEPYFKGLHKKHGVARYAIHETELPKRMMDAGFHDVVLSFVVSPAIPDNADVHPSLAMAIIETGRQVALDAVVLAQTSVPCVLADTEIDRLKWLINARFDERIRIYETGEKLWDVSASVLMIARGQK